MTLGFQKRGSAGDRRLGRDVLWNVGSLVVLGVSGVVINTVIARLQGREALGVFNQVFAFYIVLSQLAVGGLQFSVLQKVSYHHDDRRACSRIASSALLLVAAVSAIVCLVAFAGRHLAGRLLDSPAVSLGIAFVIPGLFLYSLNKLLINVVNGLRHMRAYAVFQSLRFLFILLAIVAIIRLGYPATHLPLALSLAEAVLFVGLTTYLHARQLRLTLDRSLGQWFRQHLSYGTRGVLSGILHELNTRVDILILGYFLDDAAVGLYSFAAVLAEGFGQVPVAVRWNVDPIIGRCFAEGRPQDIAALAHRVRRVFWPLMAVMGAAAVVVYPLVLRVFLPGGEFAASWAVFAILIAALTFNAGWRPFMGLLLQSGRPGTHTLLVASVAVSNAVLNLLLVPLFGVCGSATATGMAYALEALLIAAFGRKLLRVAI